MESGIISVVNPVFVRNGLNPLMNIDANKQLRDFFMNYFSGCNSLIRLLKSEFYAADEIESLFKYYVKNCD